MGMVRRTRGRCWGRWAALIFALLLALPGGPPTAAQPATVSSFVPGELLVKFQPGTPAAAQAAAHAQQGGQLLEVIPTLEVQRIRVPVGREEALAAAYARNPNVVFAEVNVRYTLAATTAAAFTPNDPLLGQQWQYRNTGQTPQGGTAGTPGADIKAFEAWGVTTGSAAVAIAILDTGIDQNHPDLSAKLALQKNVTTSRTLDDRYGHGTHVAGGAVAVTNNGAGVAGACPACALQNIKVVGDDGVTNAAWVANGIQYAADRGARVISMSIGADLPSSTLQAAIDYAWGKGAVLTCAAGNNYRATPQYPAAYVNCIAVGATTNSDAKAIFSNFGADWVDLAAPGQYLLSTAPNHRNTVWGTSTTSSPYGWLSGTSTATPLVAGTAGLLWASGQCSTNVCVRSRIEQQADPVVGTGTSTESWWRWGRLNASRALTATAP